MFNIPNVQGNEKQNHTEISSHFIRISIVKKKTDKGWQAVEKREPLYTVGENTNL